MTFREVTTDNWIACICLTTKKGEHELFEEFVASNAVSLAQSKVQDGWTTRAIYRKGYGKRALLMVMMR
jgi:diamine N-acetyltransferase